MIGSAVPTFAIHHLFSRGSKTKIEVINEPRSPETAIALYLAEKHLGEIGRCVHAEETAIQVSLTHISLGQFRVGMRWHKCCSRWGYSKVGFANQ
jgi:hypothetical protein